MLKFIIITLVVLYAISFILRVAFRALFFFAGREITKQMRQQQQASAPMAEHDGMKVYKRPKKDDGDYIDFEEVK